MSKVDNKKRERELTSFFRFLLFILVCFDYFRVELFEQRINSYFCNVNTCKNFY